MNRVFAVAVDPGLEWHYYYVVTTCTNLLVQRAKTDLEPLEFAACLKIKTFQSTHVEPLVWHRSSHKSL